MDAFPSVLSILLWPLVVYHELIQRMYTRLEPLLMQLDYSMKAEADALHHKHDKRSKEYPSLEQWGASAAILAVPTTPIASLTPPLLLL